MICNIKFARQENLEYNPGFNLARSITKSSSSQMRLQFAVNCKPPFSEAQQSDVTVITTSFSFSNLNMDLVVRNCRHVRTLFYLVLLFLHHNKNFLNIVRLGINKLTVNQICTVGTHPYSKA